MTDTNNTNATTSTTFPTTSATVGAITGYISGAMTMAHFEQALAFAKQNGIPIAGSGINAAANIVTAKVAFLGILTASLTGGVNGFSNASFSTAMGVLASLAGGPGAGVAAGSTYGWLLDGISAKTHEYEIGGQIYDMTHDQQFLDDLGQNAEDILSPLLAAINDALNDAEQYLLPDLEQAINDLFSPGSIIDISPLLAAINDALNDADHYLLPYLEQSINDLFNAAQNWVQPRRDPLTLDLDGDGLETTGFNAASPIYFDHDLNGIKEGTGWVKADDGFLVLDRNGNGVIDNGFELFGDHTLLMTGYYAADGFAALAQEDTNHDGKVDAGDARFAELRVWRDLNQNGLSEADELFTLNSLGIVSINVASTDHSLMLANGNQIADLGSYTKIDGSTGITGEVSGNLADINLVADTFHREFTDHLDTSAVAYLPDMQGSGQVRDLREAASLSATLVSTLSNFSTQTTRAGQQAQLDKLVTDWAASSNMETGMQKADTHGYQRDKVCYIGCAEVRSASFV